MAIIDYNLIKVKIEVYTFFLELFNRDCLIKNRNFTVYSILGFIHLPLIDLETHWW